MNIAGPALEIPVWTSLSAASAGSATSGALVRIVLAGFNMGHRISLFASRRIVSGHVFTASAWIGEIVTVNFGDANTRVVNITQ